MLQAKLKNIVGITNHKKEKTSKFLVRLSFLQKKQSAPIKPTYNHPAIGKKYIFIKFGEINDAITLRAEFMNAYGTR